MSLQAYDPEFHLLDPVKVMNIVIANSAIQLECQPASISFLPNMSVPQDRDLSLTITKQQLKQVIDIMRKPFKFTYDGGEENEAEYALEEQSHQDFWLDIEQGLLRTDDNPGIIEVAEQYYRYCRIPSNCQLVGYRPMGKETDHFDQEYYKELCLNHNSFLIDQVIEHQFHYSFQAFDYDDIFSPQPKHKYDGILSLLDIYLILTEKGYSNQNALNMSNLQHNLFLTIALDLANEVEYFEGKLNPYHLILSMNA